MNVFVCKATTKNWWYINVQIQLMPLQTDLIKNTAHPIEENFEEVAFKERKVQVTLLKRLWVPPPVPM